MGKVRCYTQSHSGSQPGREKLRKTDWQTVIERKEHRHQLPKTDTDHCPHSSDMPTPWFTHTFLIQIHHSGSARHSQITQNTDIHKTRTYTLQNFKHKQLRIYIFPIYRDKSNFRYTRSDSYPCTYAMQTHATPRFTDTHAQTPTPQDRHTFNTQVHRYTCPES